MPHETRETFPWNLSGWWARSGWSAPKKWWRSVSQHFRDLYCEIKILRKTRLGIRRSLQMSWLWLPLFSVELLRKSVTIQYRWNVKRWSFGILENCNLEKLKKQRRFDKLLIEDLKIGRVEPTLKPWHSCLKKKKQHLWKEYISWELNMFEN